MTILKVFNENDVKVPVICLRLIRAENGNIHLAAVNEQGGAKWYLLTIAQDEHGMYLRPCGLIPANRGIAVDKDGVIVIRNK